MSNHHPGNEWYRRLIRSNRKLYHACPKHTKLLVAKAIVEAVQEQKGRFLERNLQTGHWYMIPDKRAVDKTSQGLREKDREQEGTDTATTGIGIGSSSGSTSSSRISNNNNNNNNKGWKSKKKQPQIDMKSHTDRNDENHDDDDYKDNDNDDPKNVTNVPYAYSRKGADEVFGSLIFDSAAIAHHAHDV